MEQTLSVKWIDGEREPRCAPNLNYITGIDVDATKDGQAGCTTSVPYPAKRCGYYVVQCERCGSRAIVTTAGRIDDPRSVKLPCLSSAGQVNFSNESESDAVSLNQDFTK